MGGHAIPLWVLFGSEILVTVVGTLTFEVLLIVSSVFGLQSIVDTDNIKDKSGVNK